MSKLKNRQTENKSLLKHAINTPYTVLLGQTSGANESDAQASVVGMQKIATPTTIRSAQIRQVPISPLTDGRLLAASNSVEPDSTWGDPKSDIYNDASKNQGITTREYNPTLTKR